jgi:hypothetical protein
VVARASMTAAESTATSEAAASAKATATSSAEATATSEATSSAEATAVPRSYRWRRCDGRRTGDMRYSCDRHRM